MPFTLTMPKLSPTMESGAIVKWHKKEGDYVKPGELLLEISTDKATVEHSALDEGWLRKILLKEGGEARVNDPIAIFSEEKDTDIEGYIEKSKVKVGSSRGGDVGGAAGAGVVDGGEVNKQPKESSAGIESGGISLPQSSTALRQPVFAPEPPLENYEFNVPTGRAEFRVKASPVARKIAKEQGLDLTTVKGSGPGGRIMKDDLDKAQKLGPVVFGNRDIPKYKPGAYEEETLSPIRKVIAQRLQEAKTFIPHFYVTQQVDVKPLETAREQLKAIGIAISYNDFVVRACALALREHPHVNSGFNTRNQTISRFKTIDISIAVSIPEGLITPIIRHADFKNLGEISAEVRALAKKGREGKLQPHEFKGGSFTVSNLGMYGVTDFQAIINPPQACILAVSGIQEIPVVRGGEIVPGKVMNISLSVDHRVVDGVAAAQFIKTVQKYLENPVSLTL